MISENIIKHWIKQQRAYWAFAFGMTNGTDGTNAVLWTECSRRRYAAAPWRRSLSSHAERFPKSLFALSRCRITRMEVPDTCYPVRRSTLMLGRCRLRRRRNSEKRGKTLTRVDLFLVKTTVYIYFHILRMWSSSRFRFHISQPNGT